MDSSFFEYRDQTGVESDSGSEVIDNSLVVEDSFTSKKKLAGKNQTVFVAESEESYTEDESEEENLQPKPPKNVLRKSSVTEPCVVSSSEDDASRRTSSRRQSKMSFNKVVVSSSDEGDASPEILPKRRPPMLPVRAKSNDSTDSSFIGRKKNKRMILIDSDTENSIVIEHDKHRKQKCLKDTPLKIYEGNKTDSRKARLNASVMDQSEETDSGSDESEVDETDDTEDETNDAKDKTNDATDKCNGTKDKTNDQHDQSDYEDDGEDETNDAKNKTNDATDKCNDTKEKTNDTHDQSDYEDDGPDEDQMVMSRATRMSIMGMIPKANDDDSDDSDFIQSDEASRGSSPAELPDSNSPSTPEKLSQADSDTSRITCSPFTSPLRDVTNELNNSEVIQTENDCSKVIQSKNQVDRKLDKRNLAKNDDVVFVDNVSLKERALSNLKGMRANKENVVDDDVTIIDTKPEVIALSSDDEEDQPKKSTSTRKSKSPKPAKEHGSSGRTKVKDGTLRQYLAPPSHPAHVMYVKKHVRENELNKLERLKGELHDVKHLLDNMDVGTLPDGGARLIERLAGLERRVRAQGDLVASMVVEPDAPTAKQMANDGFSIKADEGLSWEDLQQASNAVQPRMFGKQAMATHMAERNLILERLRDLHESLASRPGETQRAAAPRAMRTQLMPHQLHALAWLRWRETQRPAGGILADDMGLGKTITMISLVVGDKEGNIQDDEDDEDEYADRGSAKLSRGGTLVVCPASLMQQWAGEVGKHCAPHAASVCLHHGAARATHAHRLAASDMVLTTYNILQRDNEKNGVLMKVLWRRIILDEAHIVRNHKSATSAAVSALRGRRRWCLTGTPVQNKDLDLFALLKFLRCTPFDDLTMWKKWIDNKSVGGQERLNTVMGCILLRRTKAQLQQKGQLNCLPERTAHQLEVTLSKEEMNVYQKVLVFSKTLFAQFLHQRAEKQADGGPLAAPNRGAYDQMHKKMIALQGAKPVKSHEILVLLLRLRQVCCHCGLIAAMLDEETAGDVQQDEGGRDLLAELNKLSLEDERSKRKSGQKEKEEEEEGPQESTTVTEAIRSVLSPSNPVFRTSRVSSKIHAVMQCLRENVFVNKGDKAVVVSQWTSVLRLVEEQLVKERVRSVTLSGAVPVPARPPLIDAVNDPRSDVRVMLLSLCAGGVGLNLCGANHLLLLDPHWNPQLEEQAQDRIYRVGQTKHVHIYRFMCVGTVEQSIRQLQKAKLELAENVLTGAKNTNASKLSIEDLKMLFNMGQA